ncbi:Phosphoribosyltransferase domain protein, partial [mine drainage metagenome]
ADSIAGIEARGFIFGAALAYELGLGFLPIRKSGKLPWKCVKEEYALEYGKDTIEMHEDAVKRGESVIIVDDLLATGGTAAAAGNIVRKLGGEPSFAFIIELAALNGAELLKDSRVISLAKL